MKIVETNQCKLADTGKELFTVTDIEPQDIPKPSKDFMDLVRQLKGLSYLNTFTADAFTEEVRKRFVTSTANKAGNGV